MTATNIVLTEDQMKRAVSRMNTDIHDRLSAGKSVSHAWLLESMSKGLFGKPYGEVRVTLLAEAVESGSDETAGHNVAPRVLLIDYGSERFLTLDGQYVTSTCPGTDMELPDFAIQAQAGTLASTHQTWVHRIELPELLNDEWEADDVIGLAEMLGYFRYARPLYELLDQSPVVLFRSAAERWALDGDYMDELRFLIDEGQPWRQGIREEIVWSPDFTVGPDKYEFYFTLAELGAAKETAPNVWIIPSASDNDVEIRLVLEG